MKILVIIILLSFAAISGYQGYVYTEFQNRLTVTEELSYVKEYGRALTTIDELRNKFWYKPVARYPVLDIFEIDKERRTGKDLFKHRYFYLPWIH